MYILTIQMPYMSNVRCLFKNDPYLLLTFSNLLLPAQITTKIYKEESVEKWSLKIETPPRFVGLFFQSKKFSETFNKYEREFFFWIFNSTLHFISSFVFYFIYLFFKPCRFTWGLSCHLLGSCCLKCAIDCFSDCLLTTTATTAVIANAANCVLYCTLVEGQQFVVAVIWGVKYIDLPSFNYTSQSL